MQRIRPLFLLLLLCAFLFRWETEQFVMWGDMIRDAPAERNLAQAVNDALSGAKPCPKCLHLSAEKTADSEADALVTPEAESVHLILCGAPLIPRPAWFRFAYAPLNTSLHNRPTSGPLLPPPILNT